MATMKILIIGHTGQDGKILAKSFKALGADVLGFSRSTIYRSGGRTCPPMPDLLNYKSLAALIAEFFPDEIYYLAAFHTSSEGTEELPYHEAFRLAQQTHVIGLVNCLDAMADHAPTCRLFYASSSLVFGRPVNEVQDEATHLSPEGFYAITKAQGMWLCHEFRKLKGLFASVGILYNHESHLRANHFLSQKIIRAAIRSSKGDKTPLILGGLDTKVDWSYAPDVVDAMQKILALKTPETFIIASGEAHTVREFAQIAFGYFNLDWKAFVIEDPSILTRQPSIRIGNPKKLLSKTGWRPTLNFEAMIGQLIRDTLAA